MHADAGYVTAFDDARGLGTVTGDDGTEHPFHCTAILDGSRTIDVGARVTFDLRPGRMGRYEAASLTPSS
jgi:cold shock CspA family protein